MEHAQVRMRRLVPFFVPGAGTLVNDALSSFDTSPELPSTLSVRTWDHATGVFNKPVKKTLVPDVVSTNREPHVKLLTPAAICGARGLNAARKSQSPLEEKNQNGKNVLEIANTFDCVKNTKAERNTADTSPKNDVPLANSENASRKVKRRHEGKRSSPEASPPRKHTARMPSPPSVNQRYAGSTFEIASPAPLSLPIPEFATKKANIPQSDTRTQDDIASGDLRRLLRM